MVCFLFSLSAVNWYPLKMYSVLEYGIIAGETAVPAYTVKHKSCHSLALLWNCWWWCLDIKPGDCIKLCYVLCFSGVLCVDQWQELCLSRLPAYSVLMAAVPRLSIPHVLLLLACSLRPATGLTLSTALASNTRILAEKRSVLLHQCQVPNLHLNLISDVPLNCFVTILTRSTPIHPNRHITTNTLDWKLLNLTRKCGHAYCWGASFFEDVPLVEFMCLIFTRMPGWIYCRWLWSLLLCLYIFWALINCLMCWLSRKVFTDLFTPTVSP